MTLTATQVKQEILDWYNDNPEGVIEEDFDYDVWTEFQETLASKKGVESYGQQTPVLASGPAYSVDSDSGEDGYEVFSIGDQLFKVEGSFNSWDGGEWEPENLHEVEPQQVSVTVYKRKAV